VGDDYLLRRCRVAAVSLGRSGPRTVFRLGVDSDCAAIVDHGNELGAAMIPPRAGTGIRRINASAHFSSTQ